MTVFTAIAAIGFGVVAYIVVKLANEKQPVEKTEKVAKSSHRRFDDAYDGSPMLSAEVVVGAPCMFTGAGSSGSSGPTGRSSASSRC